jgi:parallel beta-helix repeat protein
MLKNKICRITPAIAILTLLLAAGVAQGDTIKVCDCKACGCQFLSIQEAIDVAQPGDTVLVRSGTYYQNVVVNKPLILLGQRWHRGDLPLIDAGGGGSVITVSTEGVTVEGFRVINSGNSTGDAGIKVLSNENNIKNNVVKDNGGPGILLNSSQKNVLTGNVASQNLYGIYLTNSKDNVLSQNQLFNNTASDAFDEGINQWDNGTIGNYYGDLNCTDNDGDEICDSPYNIPGGESVDRYPLAA